ncbi:UNVERIFIED_CONTAM: hypothetical protein Sradi_2054900 [Sesamum radiatum]|uniref:Uncharacterized protein n=1 Tax=Sesamum radiatum TaxID=300843 RepID=A0AAW2TKE1_SESRA
MNLHISRGVVGACETDDGFGKGAKHPPTVNVPSGAVDGSRGVGSTKGLYGGSSAAGAAGGVAVLMLPGHQKHQG